MSTVRYWECPKHGELGHLQVRPHDPRNDSIAWRYILGPGPKEKCRCYKCGREVKEIIRPINVPRGTIADNQIMTTE